MSEQQGYQQQVTPFSLTGRLSVDGYDAYTTWGVWVDSGLGSLIQWPKLKAVTENVWQESDGVEADLSDPKLDSRELTLKFAMKECTVGHYNTFVNFLKSTVYHSFVFNSLDGRTYSLRLISYTGVEVFLGLGTIEVRFADDFPLNGYTYTAPSSTVASCDDYEIDGTLLTDYGVRVLKGSVDEIRKQGGIKEAMKRNIKVLSGVIYDSGTANKYKSRDVRLKCLMRAETLAELWECWDALLYDLIRPGERVLYCKYMDTSPAGISVIPRPGEYKCYYKSCNVTDFFPTDKIWLEFTISLCFTYTPISNEPLS